VAAIAEVMKDAQAVEESWRGIRGVDIPGLNKLLQGAGMGTIDVERGK